MTPADRILKAVHMAIDRKSALLNAMPVDEAHVYVIRLKPRGENWRASMTVETAEEAV